jgi:hypothetical protein
MSELPAPVPPPPPAAPPPPAEERPKSRRWFVALAWLTLVLFALFILGITLSVIFVPQIRKARYGAVYERGGAAEREVPA